MLSASQSIAIFSSRETPEVLVHTVAAAVAASKGTETCCDVIVNGTGRSLATAVSDALRNRTFADGVRLRVFHISVPDKAYSWNHYVHTLWPGSGLAYFIDGYARVLPNALTAIRARMGDDPMVLAGTGVPTDGRSAKRMRNDADLNPGLHGNLYAIRGEVLQHFRERGFRLPLGIYRTDPTVNAVLCFNLDPSRHDWDTRHIAITHDATWRLRALSMWNPKDLRTHFRRVQRQAQGLLENRAVRQHLAIEKSAPELLPATNYELVTNWAAAHPDEARRIFLRHPLAYRAFREIAPWSGDPGVGDGCELVASF